MDMDMLIEYIRIASIQYLGFDVVAFAHTPAMKALVIFYCFCLVYLAIQRLRKKCWFDYSLLELGAMELFLLWGLGAFGGFAMVVRETSVDKFPVLKLVVALIFFGLFVLIANWPLRFLLQTIKRYKLSGVAYWFGLMGIGLVGAILILIQFVIAVLPLMAIFIAVGISVGWNWDNHTYRRTDEDDY